MKNVGGRDIQVGMDVGGVVLDTKFVGLECREMWSKGTSSAMTSAKMVFEVRDK